MIGDQLLDGDIGFSEGSVGFLLVANFPGEDVVVVFARPVCAFHLAVEIRPQNRSIRIHRFERVRQDGKLFIFDFHQLNGIVGDVAVLGHHEGDFLVLVQHLAIGQHHLHVTGKCRHPRKIDAFQVFRRQDGDHARQFQRFGSVDLRYLGVGIGRTDEIAEHHPGQFHIIDILALALREANIFHTLALAAHAFQGGFALFPCRGHVVHSAAS